MLAFQSLDQASWQIAVEDSGRGIPSEHLDSIFDEFKRVSPAEDIKGSGLGLAITKRLVGRIRWHHGNLRALPHRVMNSNGAFAAVAKLIAETL